MLQDDCNLLSAAVSSGNEELVHWVIEECGIISVARKVR